MLIIKRTTLLPINCYYGISVLPKNEAVLISIPRYTVFSVYRPILGPLWYSCRRLLSYHFFKFIALKVRVFILFIIDEFNFMILCEMALHVDILVFYFMDFLCYLRWQERGCTYHCFITCNRCHCFEKISCHKILQSSI